MHLIKRTIAGTKDEHTTREQSIYTLIMVLQKYQNRKYNFFVFCFSNIEVPRSMGIVNFYERWRGTTVAVESVIVHYIFTDFESASLCTSQVRALASPTKGNKIVPVNSSVRCLGIARAALVLTLILSKYVV